MPLLRPATASDEPFVLALTTRLAAFPLPPWRTAAEIAVADHPILLRALRQPSADTWIQLAEEPPGTPAGFIFATTQEDYFTHEHHAHIEILAVSSAGEGRGVGRALLESAEDWSRRRGYPHLTLSVFARNAVARSVYEHLGYQAEMLRYRKTIGSAPPAG